MTTRSRFDTPQTYWSKSRKGRSSVNRFRGLGGAINTLPIPVTWSIFPILFLAHYKDTLFAPSQTISLYSNWKVEVKSSTRFRTKTGWLSLSSWTLRIILRYRKTWRTVDLLRGIYWKCFKEIFSQLQGIVNQRTLAFRDSKREDNEHLPRLNRPSVQESNPAPLQLEKKK